MASKEATPFLPVDGERLQDIHNLLLVKTPAPGSEQPDAGVAEQAYGLARLLALSDGVFAFALTLSWCS